MIVLQLWWWKKLYITERRILNFFCDMAGYLEQVTGLQNVQMKIEPKTHDKCKCLCLTNTACLIAVGTLHCVMWCLVTQCSLSLLSDRRADHSVKLVLLRSWACRTVQYRILHVEVCIRRKSGTNLFTHNIMIFSSGIIRCKRLTPFPAPSGVGGKLYTGCSA